jgi:hypothetical protein
MFEPLWYKPVKIVVTLLLVVGGYAWVSAEDWELEMEEEQARIALAEARKQPPEIPRELEADPTPVFKDPEPPIPTPLANAQNTVKKAAVKTKKRVKKALKPKHDTQAR